VLAACVDAQIKLLRALLASIADLDRALLAALGGSQDTVLAAMPRIRQINLAQILAEVGPILDPRQRPPSTPAPAQSPNNPARPPRSTPLGGQHPYRHA
jgi:hypothetical protein